MKIAIKFGDNDFSNCFRGVLKTLLEGYRHTGTLPTSKIVLCDIINGLSESCYLLFQDDSISDSTINYIKITDSKILVNEEVDEYILQTHQHNYDTYVLDTDLDFIGSFPIYSL